MPTTESPLRYPGGKTAYVPMLKDIIKKNDLTGCDYVEPFAGGAGAAVSLLLSDSVSRISLNDLDFSIYAFWKSILDYTDAFLKLLRNRKISLAEWRRQKEIYKSDDRSDILAIGFSTFYLNRCNRSGILTANPIGGLRPSESSYHIGARFNKKSLEERIIKIAALKNKISITNKDVIEFLQTYRSNNGKVLIYFDPPYYQKGCLLYLNHLTHADHKKISRSINKCKHPWILSYDEHKEIFKMYKKNNAYRRGLNYSIAEPSIGKELIFTNLKMPEYIEKAV